MLINKKKKKNCWFLYLIGRVVKYNYYVFDLPRVRICKSYEVCIVIELSKGNTDTANQPTESIF